MFNTQILKNNKGGILSWILGIFTPIIIFVIIAGAVFGYFWNATPEKIDIADVKLVGSETFRTLGFAETKFKDIYKQLKSLIKTDTSAIVSNAPTEIDKTAIDSNVEKTQNIIDAEGNVDYTKIVEKEVLYDNYYLMSYKDTTLAYLLNEIVQDAINDGKTSNIEGIDFLSSIGALLDEVTITREDANNFATVRLVMSLDATGFKTQIKEAVGKTLSGLIPIPDRVYLVSYFKITNDSFDGKKLVYESIGLKINDTENTLSSAIFSILASKAQKGDLTNKTDSEKQAIVNDKICKLFSDIIYNLGYLGTADVQEGSNIILDTSSIVYGNGGIKNGMLTLITRKGTNA